MKNDIGCCIPYSEDDNKKMTHRTDYGMMNDRPMLPRDDTAISDTSNKANETGLIIRQPL